MNAAIFITRDGQQFGPYDETALKSYIAEGTIKLSDNAWHEGREDWQPLHTLMGVPAPRMPVPSPPNRVEKRDHSDAQKTSRKITKTSGSGALIQLVGVACCFTGVGILIGIPLFIYGGKRSCVCDNCGNDVAKTSKMCPVCHALFQTGAGRLQSDSAQNRRALGKKCLWIGGLLTFVITPATMLIPNLDKASGAVIMIYSLPATIGVLVFLFGFCVSIIGRIQK